MHKFIIFIFVVVLLSGCINKKQQSKAQNEEKTIDGDFFTDSQFHSFISRGYPLRMLIYIYIIIYILININTPCASLEARGLEKKTVKL